jgi:hypothetical protein
LDARGFAIIKGHDAENFRWENVENFRSEYFMPRRQTMAVFYNVEMRRAGVVHHRTACFPDTYGMTPKTLCSVMECWRATVLGTSRPSIT